MPLRHRVLFTQMPSGGGSAVSLAELVTHLDPDRVEPCVLYYSPNPFSRRMEERGIEVRYVRKEGGQHKEAVRVGSLPGSGVKHVVRRVGGRRIPRMYEEVRVTVRDLVRTVSADRAIGREVARHVEEWNPDLVHHNNSLRGDRGPVLGGIHTSAPQVCHVRWLHDYRWVDRRVARGIDHFICVSEAVRETCRGLGVGEERLSVIYNPVDMEAADAARADPADLRDELNLPPETVLVAMVGRIVPWKGHEVFLDAVAGIPAGRASVHGLVVGGPSDDESRVLFHRLRDRASRERLPVSFIGYRDDILRVVAGCDLLVHASTRPEPFGRVVAEAMAVATAVVATRGGGVPELIEDGVTGLLVPMDDPEALTRALIHLASDPGLRSDLGCRARRRARERFSAREHADTVMATYDRLAP